MKHHETKITVRFNEIDLYRVAWHGHYVSWLEVGRNDLAGQFNLNACQLAAMGYMGLVVGLELKFLRPARFNDELTICTTLRRTKAATLVFDSDIVGPDGNKMASGTTTLAVTDTDGVLEFQLPPVIAGQVNRLLAWLEV